MTDAMVTARMPRGKKEAGGRALAKLGTNASQAINDLYDYVLANGTLPFGKREVGQRRYTQQEIDEAVAWVASFPRLDISDEIASLSKDELRRRRLISRGLATEEDFE